MSKLYPTSQWNHCQYLLLCTVGILACCLVANFWVTYISIGVSEIFEQICLPEVPLQQLRHSIGVEVAVLSDQVLGEEVVAEHRDGSHWFTSSFSSLLYSLIHLHHRPQGSMWSRCTGQERGLCYQAKIITPYNNYIYLLKHNTKLEYEC